MAQRSTERNQMSKKKCSKCSKSCDKTPQSSLGKLAQKFMDIISKVDKFANPDPAPPKTEGKSK